MRKRLFKGFSTIGEPEPGRRRNWTLYDLDLVKRDLQNHFYTLRGERVGRPDFGCSIWDYIMEPLTDNNREEIEAEARRIVESDTRVDLAQFNVREIPSGLIISMVLYYKPWDVYENFSLEFDRRQQELK